MLKGGEGARNKSLCWISLGVFFRSLLRAPDCAIVFRRKMNRIRITVQLLLCAGRGPPQFLKKRFGNAGANENEEAFYTYSSNFFTYS